MHYFKYVRGKKWLTSALCTFNTFSWHLLIIFFSSYSEKISHFIGISNTAKKLHRIKKRSTNEKSTVSPHAISSDLIFIATSLLQICSLIFQRLTKPNPKYLLILCKAFIRRLSKYIRHVRCSHSSLCGFRIICPTATTHTQKKCVPTDSMWTLNVFALSCNNLPHIKREKWNEWRTLFPSQIYRFRSNGRFKCNMWHGHRCPTVFYSESVLRVKFLGLLM